MWHRQAAAAANPPAPAHPRSVRRFPCPERARNAAAAIKERAKAHWYENWPMTALVAETPNQLGRG